MKRRLIVLLGALAMFSFGAAALAPAASAWHITGVTAVCVESEAHHQGVRLDVGLSNPGPGSWQDGHVTGTFGAVSAFHLYFFPPVAPSGTIVVHWSTGESNTFAYSVPECGQVTTTTTVHVSDKVWVCKYVGKPGVNERLKRGKNPIHVDDAATGESEVIGASFADAQGRSVIVAAGTKCPPPTPPTTTTTVAPVTTTTEVTTSTTSTTLPECREECPQPTTTTTVRSVTTTTVAPLTTTSTVAKRTTTTQVTTTTTVPTSPPRSPNSLPFTGSDSGLWLGLGLLALGAGGVLVVSMRQHRKSLP